jgi:hypothetical protein
LTPKNQSALTSEGAYISWGGGRYVYQSGQTIKNRLKSALFSKSAPAPNAISINLYEWNRQEMSVSGASKNDALTVLGATHDTLALDRTVMGAETAKI